MSDFLNEWKARTAPRVIELPSGLHVRVRPVLLENLMLSGTIPLTLMREVQAVRPRKGGGFREEDALKLTPVIDAVVLAAVIDPPLSREGSDETIALDEIPYTDRVAIFEEVNRPAAALASFRQQPDGDADAAPGGEELREAAE